MRTRHSLTAAVVALVAILVGIVLSLLAGGGPNAHADEPGPAPSVVTPAPPPEAKTTAGQRHDTKVDRRRKTGVSPSRTRATVSPHLGTAGAPADATYDVAADGRAFTAAYSSLESGADVGRPSRSQTLTVPITGDAGDATLSLALQGYVLTGDDATATLTVTVNGAATTRTYHAGTDRSYTESIDVPLRGVHGCRITVRVQVEGGDGYLNTSTIDGRLG